MGISVLTVLRRRGAAAFTGLRSAMARGGGVPHAVGVIIIVALWYLQYAYVSAAFPPTFYPASNDFMSLAAHLRDPENWGTPLRDGNTAQFRGVGYPLYLLATSVWSLNIGLIENANYGLTLVAFLASYFLYAKLFGRLIAALIVCTVALTFTPMAFAATILSEHLIISMLLIIAPLSILSVLSRDFGYRWSLAALLVALTFVKSIFAPMLALFVLFWIVEWLAAKPRREGRQYASLIGASAVGLVLVAPVNSAFVSNYNSGAFVFGIANSLVFGADTGDARLYEIYEPLFEKGLLDDASAVEVWKIVVEKARESGPVDQRFRIAKGEEARRLLFNEPTLETYWQIKWKILRGIEDEAAANALAKDLYVEFLNRHPRAFVRGVTSSWIGFLRGRALDFRYAFDDASIYRDENGLRLYRTSKHATKRFLKEWRAYGVAFDGGARRTPLPLVVDVNAAIRASVETVFGANLIVLAAWALAIAFALAMLLVRRWRPTEMWWRTAAGAFLLQGSFLGMGLGTVLFHPPLGRYFLPLLPLVLAASLLSVLSLRSTVREARTWRATKAPGRPSAPLAA